MNKAPPTSVLIKKQKPSMVATSKAFKKIPFEGTHINSPPNSIYEVKCKILNPKEGTFLGKSNILDP